MTTGSDVLVVDDDPDMVDAIEMALESQGYRCRHASNGRAALEQIASAPPALVLLDMLMPVMNGWECMRAVREAYRDTVPIVIVTAAEHAEARRCEVGADGVLTKPFDLAELLATVGRFVRSNGDGARVEVERRQEP